jgi:Flp pilus assembly protein TadB
MAAAAGVLVIAPGFYVGKEVYEAVKDPRASTLEMRLTQAWSGVAGFLLSLLLGVAAVLICFGLLLDVKLWFIGLCWTALLIPWWLVGYFGRKVVRRFSPPFAHGTRPMTTEATHGA